MKLKKIATLFSVVALSATISANALAKESIGNARNFSLVHKQLSVAL